MRLLRRGAQGEFSLAEYVGNDIPDYAILSHTWGLDQEELTYRDVVDGAGQTKAGYKKILFCSEQAAKDGIQHCWVDTCCIDKTNSTELTEAINSMFRWYRNATKCYVYLADVPYVDSSATDSSSQNAWQTSFRTSRWFTRGWTLQELIAPQTVEFFSIEGERLGDKSSLRYEITEITGIPEEVLQGQSLHIISINERMSWASRRLTKREEDAAYSLLGIFDVHMPLLYGEGRERAFHRLRKEIQEVDDMNSAALARDPPKIDSGSDQGLGFILEQVHILPAFTPRPEYLKPMEYLLPSTSHPVGRKVFVLYGLGGIGKTQLALKFAKDHQQEFTSVLFLDASSEESLLKSFALTYRRITDGKGPQMPSPKMAEEVVQWLTRPSNKRWLLIFDNVDKEPSDEGGFDIVPYFPAADHGSILITSRLVAISRLGQCKKVGRMSDDEATTLLGEMLGNMPGQQITVAPDSSKTSLIRALLDSLDGLPLAISQAGRFINALNIKVDTYLEWYISSKRELMDMISVSYLDQEAERSIRTTWTTSLNLLKRKASIQGVDGDFHAAYHLLRLFAYFEPTNINYEILRFGVIGHNVPEWYRRTFSSKLRFFSIIKILLDLCLIDNNVAEGTYSMHRVVHDWLCTYVCGETDRELLRIAVAAISFSAPLIMTDDWFYEQQQLALHALNILPRLRDPVPEDFLVRYDEMSAEELALAASLLKEPVKCWKLMKFDYTLLGIARLLKGSRQVQSSFRVIKDTQARCPEILEGGTVNPVFVLLRHQQISGFGHAHTDLPELADIFYGLGSPSWAVKSLNLYALMQESYGLDKQAIELWEKLLDESRGHTGSIFIHPTWMVFNNLCYRLRHNTKRLFMLTSRYVPDARSERDKLKEAAGFLQDLRYLKIRLGGSV